MQNLSDSPDLILASQSPRRRYLLEQAGLQFSVIPSTIDEDAITPCEPETYVRILAEAKCRDIAEKYPDNWVIGADTVVLIGNTILGKPDSRTQARDMLSRLSGQTHKVLTGYALFCIRKKRFISDVVTTEVLFKKLTHKEIDWYTHTKEPFDKAGAYAIQGLGTFLVRRINGSYTNVVGLPVCEVIEHLIREGVINMEKTVNHVTEKKDMS